MISAASKLMLSLLGSSNVIHNSSPACKVSEASAQFLTCLPEGLCTAVISAFLAGLNLSQDIVIVSVALHLRAGGTKKLSLRAPFGADEYQGFEEA